MASSRQPGPPEGLAPPGGNDTPPRPADSGARVRRLLGWVGDSVDQLQLAIDAADLGLWHWNPSTSELLWSERFRSLVDLPAEVPSTLEALSARIHAADRERLARSVEEALQTGGRITQQFRIVRADGEVRWLQAIGSAAVSRTQGTPIRMSGVLKDVTDSQRSAEAMARYRQERLQLMRSAPVGIGKFDRQLRVVGLNQRLLEGLKISDPSPGGRPLSELLPAIPQYWLKAFERGLAGEASSTENDRYTRVDGSMVVISWHVYPWFDEFETIGGVVLLADVQTAERLPEEQQRIWARVFAENADGMAIADPETGCLQAANPALAALVGCTADELAGRPLLSLFRESDQAKLRDAADRAAVQGSVAADLNLRRRDGAAVPVMVTWMPVKNARGAVQRAVLMIVDLREQVADARRLQEAQKLADRQFRLIADSTPLGIVQASPAGRVTYANPAWLAITAQTLGQALDRDWFEFVHPDDRERVRAVWDRAHQSGVPVLEFRYRRPGGEVRWVQSHAAVIRNESGATLGYLRTSLDITERLQERAATDHFHGQVRALAQRLQQLREVERSEIAGALQDEVQDGLAQMESRLAELGRRSSVDDAARLVLKQLAALAASTLQNLRTVIFDLAPPGIEELGFERALQDFVREHGERSGRHVTLTLPPQALQGHQWTLAVLYEVAKEAIANAIHHADAGHIEVRVEVREQTLRLRVRDDGIGMTEADRHKPGTFGLLALAERVRQIEGALRIVSVADQGTTVEVSVPL